MICMIIMLTWSLFGCSIDKEKADIYDNNKSILQEGDKYSFYHRDGEADEKHIDIKYNSFYGVQTLWVIQIEQESEIKIDYNSLVKSGNFKVVLVTPEQEITTIAEQSSKGAFIVAAPKGKYRVKIVGKNAIGNIQVDLLTHEENKISVQEN